MNFAGISDGTLFDYNKVETNVQTFTIRYNIVFASAVFASMVAMPSLVAAFDYFRGTYDYNSWYLPLVTMWVFHSVFLTFFHHF